MKRSNSSTLRTALLRWYDRVHRKMPWRPVPGHLGNPYHVLVSELMLQQTQVATVIPYFERFIARWPTVTALADANEQEVLHAWQGLGYYRRARHLHEAARMIERDFAGQIPDDVETLLQLPGVGRYTAGAIASIAFGRPAPILDGNVARILARLYSMHEPVDVPTGQKQLWQWAQDMVTGAKRPGDVNQAMMELGATVCTPAGPACLNCPVARHCASLAHVCVDQVPVKAGKTQAKSVRHTIIAIRHRNRFLLTQRPDAGLWAGMWEFPTWEQAGTAVTQWVKQYFRLTISQPEPIGDFTHITTHRRISFDVQLAVVNSVGRNLTWRTLDDLDDLPMSNAQKRALNLIRAYIS